jgi:cobalt/nickel transport system permease protein
MSTGHHPGGHLYVGVDSPLHRLAPEAKVAGAVAFLFALVLSPRGVWVPVALAAAVVVILAVVGRIPARIIGSRLLIETPFVLFALLMPFFGEGERVEVLGVGLYVDGIEAGATLFAKSTIGVGLAIVLAATTTVADILRALRRLQVPGALVLVMQLMLRYAEVLLAEARRMNLARQSRAYEPRWLWQARGFAAGLGSLFVRSFERGERVHRAMLARGFTGALPAEHAVAQPHDWAVALVPAVLVATAVVLT